MSLSEFKRTLVLVLCSVVLQSCGIDRDAPEYDQLRYEQLQKTRCHEMAAVLSKPLVSRETEDYDTTLKRCEAMKSLNFEEYKVLSDHARQTGVWDVYGVFPGKFGDFRPE